MEIREVNLVTGLTVDEGTHGVWDIGRVKNHHVMQSSFYQRSKLILQKGDLLWNGISYSN